MEAYFILLYDECDIFFIIFMSIRKFTFVLLYDECGYIFYYFYEYGENCVMKMDILLFIFMSMGS